MKLGILDHVNVRTKNIEAMKTWYTDILGMHVGDRPNLQTAGAWMYVGDHPVVHLVATDDEILAGSESQLKLEHFALTASGMKDLEKRLTAAGEKFAKREVPGIGVMQFNIWDPDGNHIHIDFTLANET